VVPPQELATNSQDAKELPPPELVELLTSKDLMSFVSSQEPPKEDVTDLVSANKKQKGMVSRKNEQYRKIRIATIRKAREKEQWSKH